MDFVLKSNLRIFFRNCFTDFFSQEFTRIFAQRFLRGFSLELSFADFLSNTFSLIFLQILFSVFSFEYSFADFHSNMVMWDHKKSYEGVLFTKLFIQGFTKSNKSFKTLFYFSSKEIFAQIFFDFFRIFFRGFSFEYF